MVTPNTNACAIIIVNINCFKLKYQLQESISFLRGQHFKLFNTDNHILTLANVGAELVGWARDRSFSKSAVLLALAEAHCMALYLSPPQHTASNYTVLELESYQGGLSSVLPIYTPYTKVCTVTK